MTTVNEQSPERELHDERACAEQNGDCACLVPEMTGPVVSVEHVGLPSPDAHAVAAAVQPVEQLVPIGTQIRRIIHTRSAGQLTTEQATRAIVDAVIERLPVPVGSHDAEAWSEHQLARDELPTTAGYLDYLLARITVAVTR